MQATDLATSQPPIVLARAIQAVGELGRANLYATCRPHLASDVIMVRCWTAWTLTLRTASGESRKTLQWFATARSPFAADTGEIWVHHSLKEHLEQTMSILNLEFIRPDRVGFL